MAEEFARRLRDIIEGVRAEARHATDRRVADATAAKARRRHLERVCAEEARSLVEQTAPVLAGLGLREVATPAEFRVEPIRGARPPEAFPPWLRIACRPAAAEDIRVAVLEVNWRVDDPRTPLPEAPNTVRLVVDDDGPAARAETREFLAVAVEEFCAAVTRFDALPRK